MKIDLGAKVALVLGASGGIGKAVAKELVAAGATVYLSSRNEERLKMAQTECGAAGYVISDSTKIGSLTRACTELLKKVPSIDILVANTGGPQKNAFSDVSLEQWQNDFQSLLLSVVEAVRVVSPGMRKNNFGRILMISSLSAKEPLKGLTTSSVLRAGLSGLVKTMSNEYAVDGIAVNAILPGYTATDRLKELNLSEEFVKSTIPAARLADPQEVAYLATFLASEKAAYINGQSILVDGGANKAIF